MTHPLKAFGDACRDFAAATANMTRALNLATVSTERAIALLNTPAVRRLIYERQLGHKIPDWVWHVEEQQRRQFGSGNGRKIRE